MGPGFGVNGMILVESINKTLPDRAAAFGPRLPTSDEGGLSGDLVWVGQLDRTNSYGCNPITASDLQGQPWSQSIWFALVQRGECAFVEKVRAMQRSGATAVIVGDPLYETLVTMYSPDITDDIAIPSVFVGQSAYRELCALLNSPPVPVRVRLVHNGLYNLPLADVILVTVFSPVIMLLVVYALFRIRQYQRHRRELAPQDFVAGLPTKTFFIAKKLPNEPEECAICLEDYVDEDEIRILPCYHQFHTACVDVWLTTRKRCCPICKQDICNANERTPLLWAGRRTTAGTPTDPSEPFVAVPNPSLHSDLSLTHTLNLQQPLVSPMLSTHSVPEEGSVLLDIPSLENPFPQDSSISDQEDRVIS
ncbi:hypothetical protein IWQ62_002031 [Dispira parvispora]|uniref:RING-type E3 ubiquitin transferase n=1 Tax=Dispira parvispora TaxID=1520584 RepID=A0A9W8AUR5_9FUNG|nr:hypothetical protein IWQ62_002031 [Dispira parvispora]